MRDEGAVEEGGGECRCYGCGSVYVSFSFLYLYSPLLLSGFLAGVSAKCKVLGTGCAVKDLDVSRGVFKKLADLDLGRVSVDWAWLEEAPVSVR